MPIFRGQSATLQSTLTLTGSTVSTTQLDVEGWSDIILDVTYITGAGETNNTLHISAQTASAQRSTTTGLVAENDWYDMQTQSVSGGTITLADADYTISGAAAATTYKKAFSLTLQDKFIRFGFYEQGVATNFGSILIKYVLVNKYQ